MATQTLDEKGNVVVDGMNTNVTPSQFQAISTNAFTPTKPLPIPQPQPQDVSGIVGQEIANIGALQAKYDTANTQASDIYSQLAGLSTQNKDADLATAYQTGGVNDAASKIRQLNAQAQALNLEEQAVPLQVQQESIGRGRTEAGIAPLQTARLRENALKALSLGQQAALAQADYQTAKDKADQMITIKYADIENQINTKKLQLDALDRFVLTPAQERLKEARALALKKEERDLEEKKANEIAINDMIIQATPNAPTNVIANAKKIAEQGGSKLAVAQALGVYGGDFLKNELLREQLKTEKAQRAKIYSEMGAKTQIGVTPQVSSATDLQNATANLKLTEAQSKALAFGQRAINADRALRARLESYDPTTIFSATGRLLKTDNARAFERDLGDFITAVLRKESGATITEDEFDRFIPLYSPQGIMTNQEDVKQTNLKRQGAIDALISEAGPASAALAAYKNSEGSFISTGNQLADEYVKSSMKAVSNVNNSMTTPNAVNAGYIDNQK